MRGRFISVEGVEGVGKTTNLAFIVDYLSAQGVDVLQTREPGGTAAGEQIRSVLLDPASTLSAPAELLLMYAARMQLISESIQPALAAGRWVVADRFNDASFAYQGGGRELGFDRVAVIDDWVLQGLKPDCTLFLDLEVEAGLGRLSARDSKDRIEREPLEFFERVRQAYHQRINAEPERFYLVDAAQPLAQVQQDLQQALDLQLATANRD